MSSHNESIIVRGKKKMSWIHAAKSFRSQTSELHKSRDSPCYTESDTTSRYLESKQIFLLHQRLTDNRDIYKQRHYEYL